MGARKVVRAEEVRWACTNCGAWFSTRANARVCCSRCEALLPHPEKSMMAIQCGNPRQWSAPLRGEHSDLFPLGYCALHRPSHVAR